MSKGIKLLALDIDGTILRKDYTMSERVKKTIRQAFISGIKVVLVTGRMHRAALPIIKELGLNTPILSYQGALAKKGDEELYSKCISDGLCREIILELQKFDVQINLYLDDELYSQTDDFRVIEYCEKRGLNYKKVDSLLSLPDLTANKILAIGHGADDTTEVLMHLKKKFYNNIYVVKSMPIFCEITSSEVSKGRAISYLAEQWGVPMENTMAIGDQDNDIELLKVVELKVAMGNATESLKQVADFVTDSVEEDGVATAIEKYLLEKKHNV